jgi:mRNA-degrading endonuclease RelE of RelBE toxin-antitoxin system
MTRYTVTYARHALQELARLWLSAFDRRAITKAGHEVDQMLRDDASQKGSPVGSKYRQLVVGPIVIEFSVEEDDRTVTVWTVRHIGELTNGR